LTTSGFKISLQANFGRFVKKFLAKRGVENWYCLRVLARVFVTSQNGRTGEKRDFETTSTMKSFPPAPTFVLQVNIFHLALVTNKGTEQPADNADHKRTKDRSPESPDIKAGYYPGGHFKHEGIYHESKKTQAEDIDRKRQNDEYRSEKGIQHAQHGCRKERREKTAHLYPIQQVRTDHDGRR
jgi:hypothetical protein